MDVAATGARRKRDSICETLEEQPPGALALADHVEQRGDVDVDQVEVAQRSGVAQVLTLAS